VAIVTEPTAVAVSSRLPMTTVSLDEALSVVCWQLKVSEAADFPTATAATMATSDLAGFTALPLGTS
jgi:hypothetical protein